MDGSLESWTWGPGKVYFEDVFALRDFCLGERKLQFIIFYFSEPSLQAVCAETMVDGLPRAYRFDSRFEFPFVQPHILMCSFRF